MSETVIAALITLVGTVSTATINNWPKLFPPKKPSGGKKPRPVRLGPTLVFAAAGVASTLAIQVVVSSRSTTAPPPSVAATGRTGTFASPTQARRFDRALIAIDSKSPGAGLGYSWSAATDWLALPAADPPSGSPEGFKSIRLEIQTSPLSSPCRVVGLARTLGSADVREGYDDPSSPLPFLTLSSLSHGNRDGFGTAGITFRNEDVANVREVQAVLECR
jgi:hypothetical protein